MPDMDDYIFRIQNQLLLRRNKAIIRNRLGDLMTIDSTAAFMKLSVQDVQRLYDERELLALVIDEELAFPRIQFFQDGRRLPRLDELFAALGYETGSSAHSAWATADALIVREEVFGGFSMFDAARQGRHDLIDLMLRQLASDGFV